ncbi:OsmC/Ohr family [Thermoascus aurantiacus ATCC 26904]
MKAIERDGSIHQKGPEELTLTEYLLLPRAYIKVETAYLPHHHLYIYTELIYRHSASSTMFRPTTVFSRLASASTRLPLTTTRQFSSTARSLNNNNNKIPFRVDGRGHGVAQTVTVKGSPHQISTDAYTSFGGQDSAPTPLAYALTALSSCTQVTGSLVAKDLGAKLGEWRVTVNGELDPTVLVTGKEGNANWDNVELIVNVQTDIADEATFRRFSEETERRCPISQLYKRSGAGWKSRWVNEKL